MSKISVVYTFDNLLAFLPTPDCKSRLLASIRLDYHIFFKDIAEYLRLGCYSFSGKSGFYENQDAIALVAFDIWLNVKKIINKDSRIGLLEWHPLPRGNRIPAYELTIEITSWNN